MLQESVNFVKKKIGLDSYFSFYTKLHPDELKIHFESGNQNRRILNKRMGK